MLDLDRILGGAPAPEPAAHPLDGAETSTPGAYLPGDDSPGWQLIHRLWDAGYSLTLEQGADGRPVLVPISHGRDDPGLFEQFDQYHDDAAKIVAGWPNWMTDPAVLSEVPAADDGWPADSEPADWTCPECGYAGWWEDLHDNRHCLRCEAERFGRARRLAERVAQMATSSKRRGLG